MTVIKYPLLRLAMFFALVLLASSCGNDIDTANNSQNDLFSIDESAPGSQSDDPFNNGKDPNISLDARAALLWNYNMDTTPKNVSVGANATQLFSQIEFGSDQAMLFGTSPNGNAAPIWSNPISAEGANAYVDSSQETDTHVALHQIVPINNNGSRQTIVSKYNGGASQPHWTWTFPGTTSSTGRIAISNNGQRIAALNNVPSQTKAQLAVFSANSNIPIYRELINFGTYVANLALSADGSTLLAVSNSSLWVINANDPALPTITQRILPGLFIGAQAISGDGSYIAWGEFNRTHLLKRNIDNTYSEVFVRNVDGSIVTDRLALSTDSSTLVIGSHYFDQNLKVRIEAINLRAGNDGIQHFETLLLDEPMGSGSFQNIVSAIDTSTNGHRIAVGLWGDEGNLVPEVRFYMRNADNSFSTLRHFNLPGSVYDLSMSADGSRVGVAAKPVHANTFAVGGRLQVYGLQ